MTAILSRAVLGRKYSSQQWFAMALLFVASMAFLQVRMLFADFAPSFAVAREMGDAKMMLLMLEFLMGLALSCVASILAERFLKKRQEARARPPPSE